MHNIKIYTDGACRGNPGKGGWAAVLIWQTASPSPIVQEKEICGYQASTTNNQMELTAVIKALEILEPASSSTIEIYSDSQYVTKGISQWVFQWKKNGWKTAAKKPVKNQYLWQRLSDLVALYHINWHWVKGHSGHTNNERADALANWAIDHRVDKTNE